MTKHHNLIIMRHVIVRQSNRRRANYSINKPVFTVRQRTLINPNMIPSEDRHTVTVWYRFPPVMSWGASHLSVPTCLAVMFMNLVDYNVGHVLDRHARPPAMCTVAQRPSMVLKEFMMSSSLRWMVMSRWKMIQSGSSCYTVCINVPGLGVSVSSFPESVTT